MSSPSAFDQLVESQLDLLWHIDQVSATGAGIRSHDHRLRDYDPVPVRGHLAALRCLVRWGLGLDG